MVVTNSSIVSVSYTTLAFGTRMLDSGLEFNNSGGDGGATAEMAGDTPGDRPAGPHSSWRGLAQFSTAAIFGGLYLQVLY